MMTEKDKLTLASYGKWHMRKVIIFSLKPAIKDSFLFLMAIKLLLILYTNILKLKVPKFNQVAYLTELLKQNGSE
jgi:hypothetical protein